MPEINTFLASAVFGLFVCLLVTALQFTGIINMNLARICLFAAWLVAVVGVCGSLEHAPVRHLGIAAILTGIPLGVVLIVVERWITLAVQRREARSLNLVGQRDTKKRDFLIERLTDFTREAGRSWELSGKFREFYVQSRSLEVGLWKKIEKFLEVHLPNEVERFKGKGIDGVEEIISELLCDHKLLLEVDVALGMDGWKPRQSSLVLFRDKGVFSPPGMELVLIDRYELKAGLRIRFDNRDSSPQRERSVSVVLRTGTDSQRLHVAAYEDGRYVNSLSDIRVQGGDVSPYYNLTCDATLELETVAQLGSSSYLRVTLEAINQDLYCVDLSVDWNKAREGKEVFFAIQRKGDCAESSRLISS